MLPPSTPPKFAATTVDPLVADLVAQVDQGALLLTVTDLVGIHNRRADQPGGITAQNQLVSRFQAIPGLAVSVEALGGGYHGNVVAELPGSTASEEVVVIGAHYDSVNWQGNPGSAAPGADDNASGTAVVLEAARVLASSPVPFRRTVRFIAFGAEEFGLVGAYEHASNASASGESIVAMLNCDMAAYKKPGDTHDVDFATNSTSAELTSFCQDATGIYVPGLGIKSGPLTAGSSDHAAFTSYGFPSAFFFEDLDDYSPYIHTAGDTLGASANDFGLAADICRALVASAALLAEPTDMALDHDPLPDTQNDAGPYQVAVQAIALDGDTVTGIDVIFSVDGGVETSVALATTGSGSWTGGIPGQPSPATVAYRIEATDSSGHTAWLPDDPLGSGATYAFTVGSLEVIASYNFEATGDQGWTHGQSQTQDDWQRGSPQGSAGDPGAAAGGAQVWGNDLGPSGWNGEYQPDVHNWLDSPSFDLTGKSGARLRFQRWLTVEEAQYDQARIEVGGALAWENPYSGHVLDGEWTQVDLDVAALADSQGDVRVRFSLESDGGLEFGGWNIDDFELITLGPSPPAPPIALAPASGPAVGFTAVTATAIGAGTAVDVRVGGQSVAFEALGADALIFQTPTATVLGSVPVEIVWQLSNPATAGFTVIATDPPAVAGAAQASLGGSLPLAVGGPPGGVFLLLASPLLGPTPLPGLPALSIGGGSPATLIVLVGASFSPAGTAAFQIDVPHEPSLAGLVLHFQALTADSGLTVDASSVHTAAVSQ